MDKETLYNIRKELGWTMRQTGEKTGYSTGLINNMEKGRESLSLPFIFSFKLAVREHLKGIPDRAKKITKMIK